MLLGLVGPAVYAALFAWVAWRLYGRWRETHSAPVRVLALSYAAFFVYILALMTNVAVGARDPGVFATRYPYIVRPIGLSLFCLAILLQADFTRRQRDFARRTNAVTVYTPELILSGSEYRRWWGNSFERALQQVNRTAPRADIGLKLDRAGSTLHVDSRASVRDKSTAAASASFYVALYQSNLSNKIVAGENSGRTLDHAFVVRRLYGPFAFDSAGATQFNQKLTLDAGWKTADLGVAAFVQESRGTKILQALSLDVCS